MSLPGYRTAMYCLPFLLTLPSVAAQTVDPATGLRQEEGWETVRATCTQCHSAQLITQNSGSRSVWQSRIAWMQDTQGLRQLEPEEEDVILTYLSAQYGPKQSTRRAALAARLLPTNPYPVAE